MPVEAITDADFEKALKAYRVWDVGNDVLYKLCREYPNHDDPAHIIAKAWLIGRTYAVSLERHAGSAGDSDEFYVGRVVPSIQSAGLDPRLMRFTPGDTRTAEASLGLHKALVNALHQLGGKDRRSFASKYLHFHCPDHFFIYDSNAVSAITKLAERLDGKEKRLISRIDCDSYYGEFFYRCEHLTKRLASIIGRSPTPRELDKLLLFRHSQMAKKGESSSAGDFA